MRFVRPLVVVAAVVVALSGCSAAASAPTGGGSGTLAAGSSSGATKSAVRIGAPMIAKETFAGPAVTRYGQGQVQAAYQEMAQFSARETLNPARIAKTVDQVSPADMASVKAYLTKDAARSWDTSMVGLSDQSSDGSGRLYGIAYYGLNNVQYTLRTDVAQPSVSIQNTKIGLDGDGKRLSVTMDVNGSIRYVSKDGSFARMKVDKTVTYWLDKGTSKDVPWLIDGWQTTFRTEAVAPDVK